MECRCANITELQGADAELYAAGHLVADGDKAFVCPDTGKRWLLETVSEQAVLTQTSPT